MDFKINIVQTEFLINEEFVDGQARRTIYWFPQHTVTKGRVALTWSKQLQFF